MNQMRVSVCVCVSEVDYEAFSLIDFSPNEQRAEGGAARLFLSFFFPCSADHERDWPPCKKVPGSFFGLATNALNVRNNSNRFFFKQQQRFCGCCAILIVAPYNILPTVVVVFFFSDLMNSGLTWRYYRWTPCL